MDWTIQFPDFEVGVTYKRVKYLRITIKPPFGEVRVSAPLRTSRREIQQFVESRLEWITLNRTKIRSRPIVPQQNYESGDLVLVRGKRLRLLVVEKQAKPTVESFDDVLRMVVRPGSTKEQRLAVFQSWMRDLLRETIPPLIEKWEPIIGVRVRSFTIRSMKTRWGSCNTRAHTIRFNTDLIQKDPRCLEYVVVHELVHLLERSHNARFKGFMDRFMPDWRDVQRLLNQSTVPGSMDL